MEPRPEEVEFLNDLRAYDTQNLAWYGLRARGKRNSEQDLVRGDDLARVDAGHAVPSAIEAEAAGQRTMEAEGFEVPEGRYGHIAAALDENRLLIFGGRGADGRNLRDTWVYHCVSDRWQLVRTNEDQGLPLPKPRHFAACVSVPVPPLRRTRATSSIMCTMKESDRDVYMFGG